MFGVYGRDLLGRWCRILHNMHRRVALRVFFLYLHLVPTRVLVSQWCSIMHCVRSRYILGCRGIWVLGVCAWLIFGYGGRQLYPLWRRALLGVRCINM